MAKLEPSLLDAIAWKRLFFERHSYPDVESLVAAAASGGEATAYIQAILDLGHIKRRRRTVSDLYVALRESTRPHWVHQFLSALWVLYSTERRLWKREKQDDALELATATRAQRGLLCGTGLVAKRLRPLKERAETQRQRAIEAATDEVYALWVDNYNKFRYSRNPHENRDMCINATVMAMLALGDVQGSLWHGWPAINHIFAAARDLASQLVQHHKVFTDGFRRLRQRNLQHEHVRVPCDIRRYEVVSLPWVPFKILDADIKCGEGLQPQINSVTLNVYSGPE